MPLFIKESFIYKLFEKLLIIPYNNSLLKKNLQKESVKSEDLTLSTKIQGMFKSVSMQFH